MSRKQASHTNSNTLLAGSDSGKEIERLITLRAGATMRVAPHRCAYTTPFSFLISLKEELIAGRIIQAARVLKKLAADVRLVCFSWCRISIQFDF